MEFHASRMTVYDGEKRQTHLHSINFTHSSSRCVLEREISCQFDSHYTRPAKFTHVVIVDFTYASSARDSPSLSRYLQQKCGSKWETAVQSREWLQNNTLHKLALLFLLAVSRVKQLLIFTEISLFRNPGFGVLLRCMYSTEIYVSEFACNMNVLVLNIWKKAWTFKNTKSVNFSIVMSTNIILNPLVFHLMFLRKS